MYNVHMNEQGLSKPPFSVFFATACIIFATTLSAAYSIGFVPYYVDGTAPVGQSPLGGAAKKSNDAANVTPSNLRPLALSDLPELGDITQLAAGLSVRIDGRDVTEGVSSKPTRIIIPAIDLDLPVQNPSARDVPTLDEYLKKGPVRYTDSAKLGVKGNVLIFAHTSNLPVVRNQMYKAFNDIPKLEKGDTITLKSEDGTSYLYSVQSVRRADATTTTIDLSASGGTRLTLVTCDTLTSKSTRFVLEAVYIGVVN